MELAIRDACPRASTSGFPPPPLPDEGWADRRLTRLGSALDRAAMRAMALALDFALMPSEADLERIRASAAPYLSPRLRDRPAAFFDFLHDISTPRLVWSRGRRRLPEGAIISRGFHSDYSPYHCPEDDRFACAENSTIPVEHWVHEWGAARGTIIALHGF